MRFLKFFVFPLFLFTLFPIFGKGQATIPDSTSTPSATLHYRVLSFDEIESDGTLTIGQTVQEWFKKSKWNNSEAYFVSDGAMTIDGKPATIFDWMVRKSCKIKFIGNGTKVLNQEEAIERLCKQFPQLRAVYGLQETPTLVQQSPTNERIPQKFTLGPGEGPSQALKMVYGSNWIGYIGFITDETGQVIPPSQVKDLKVFYLPEGVTPDPVAGQAFLKACGYSKRQPKYRASSRPLRQERFATNPAPNTVPEMSSSTNDAAMALITLVCGDMQMLNLYLLKLISDDKNDEIKSLQGKLREERAAREQMAAAVAAKERNKIWLLVIIVIICLAGFGILYQRKKDRLNIIIREEKSKVATLQTDLATAKNSLQLAQSKIETLTTETMVKEAVVEEVEAPETVDVSAAEEPVEEEPVKVPPPTLEPFLALVIPEDNPVGSAEAAAVFQITGETPQPEAGRHEELTIEFKADPNNGSRSGFLERIPAQAPDLYRPDGTIDFEYLYYFENMTSFTGAAIESIVNACLVLRESTQLEVRRGVYLFDNPELSRTNLKPVTQEVLRWINAITEADPEVKTAYKEAISSGQTFRVGSY